MSGADKLPLAKDTSSTAGSALVADDRLRNEAFEQSKKEAISLTQNGGISLTPDTYLNLTRGQNPWGPPIPIEIKPPAPTPGTVNPPLPGDGGLLHTGPTIETTASKLGREALVIGGGVGESFFYGIANLPDHLPQIGSSIMIGGTLGAIAKTGRLGAGAALVVGAYFTSRFILDTINDHKRWDKFGAAVKDTWHSGDNFYKNMHEVRDTFGNYTFDTTLSMASSYVGYKNPQLGELILGILRIPPIVPSATPPFSPALTLTSMALDVMPPSGFYREYDDKTPFAPSSWQFDLHGSLHRVPGIITRTPDLLHDGDGRDRDGDRDGDRDKRK